MTYPCLPVCAFGEQTWAGSREEPNFLLAVLGELVSQEYGR